jgi:rhamnogalacturonyl hydrolase YesR
VKRLLLVLSIAVLLPARSALIAQSKPDPAAAERDAAGDQPDDPGPLATNLSPAMNRSAILHAVRLVADWQLAHAEGRYNIQWTYAALYDGMLAASRATGDPRYRDRVRRVAEENHWQLGLRYAHADDEAVGLAYLSLYAGDHNRDHLAPTRDTIDRLLARPDDPKTNLWWWCDALYMAPPVLAQLSVATGDARYLDFMDHEWSLTTAALYDPREHLYFRDNRFLTMHEANGQKIFWSRGNGWVLAGLAMVIERLPQHDPRRSKYIEQYQTMAARIADLQPPDGLWRASLLDTGAYHSPEISGSAFFTYSMAWGIHHHLLDRKKFQPVVARAWSGMLTHIYQDGRLGSIQPIGGEPDRFQPSSSYVYGVGAFLLAGSELAEMAK